jgi:hypothetical protein
MKKWNRDINEPWLWRCKRCGGYMGKTDGEAVYIKNRGTERPIPIRNRGPYPRVCPHCGEKYTVTISRPRTDEEARRMLRGD